MQTNLDAGNRQLYNGRRFASAGAIVSLSLLALALLACGIASSSFPSSTTEPPIAATAPPTWTEAVADSSATPLATRVGPIPSDTARPVPSPTTTPLLAVPAVSPAEAQSSLRSSYILLAELDYERHHLAVSQIVTYVNRTGEPLAELLFVVEPNRQPGTFRLHRLNWTDGQAIESFRLEGSRLQIPLPAPLAPGARVGMYLFFELDLPARSGPFGYTSRQTNLGDWYPYIPPYRAGQGWLVHEPAIVGEHLVYDVADYRVEIDLAGPHTDLEIAASAPAERNGTQYRYQLDAARSFAWSVSPEYQILQEPAGSAMVVSYVFPEHLSAGQAALRASMDALALYAELFHPYPHTSLAIVEADFADGMEYDGLYFLGREYYEAYAGSPQGYLTTIAVHEASHQWWYGLVGNDQASEPWLDEALAVYSELLFYERVYPDLIDWWWEFRVKRFSPSGRVSSTIYDHDGFQPYVNAVYLRGALFVDGLHRLVGDEAFFAFLRDYATRYVHSQVTAEDFFTTLAEHTAVDLSTLTSVYFAPVATPIATCHKPVEDYTRVTVNGETVNRRTALMLDTAVALYGGPGDLRRVVQGSYTDELAASFGTHAGGGVVDISIRNPAQPSEYLFQEVEAMVQALRQAGFAAWYRAPGEVYEGSAPHIHAVAIGDQELFPAAQEQLTGSHGYFRGMDGLPRNPPQPDPHGGPVICSWMLEAGYADLREENTREMP